MSARLPFFEERHDGWRDRARAAAAALASEPEGRAREIVRELGRRGLFDCFGLRGGRPDVRALCVARAELAYRSALADTLFAVQGLGSVPILLFGDSVQREAYLPQVREGQFIAAFAITEPGAGSDLGAIACRAVRDGDDYVISGTKTFISNAGIADYLVVFARTSDERSRFLSAFVIPKDAQGLSVVRDIPLIAPHPIGEIAMTDLRLPGRNRLGEEGDGLRIALATLHVFRPSVGAAALGLARRAMDETLLATSTRVQFGKPLAEMQGVEWILAEMATDIDASELLVARAAWLQDVHESRSGKEASMAKWYATEAAQRVVDRAVQLHGGRGVVAGETVERLYREVRALRIYEGTTEIQKSIVARELKKARAEEAER
ncbi:MAG: acyl-CoA dehydrogenase family protein [Acidobacteriota bacterium]